MELHLNTLSLDPATLKSKQLCSMNPGFSLIKHQLNFSTFIQKKTRVQFQFSQIWMLKTCPKLLSINRELDRALVSVNKAPNSIPFFHFLSILSPVRIMANSSMQTFNTPALAGVTNMRLARLCLNADSNSSSESFYKDSEFITAGFY